MEHGHKRQRPAHGIYSAGWKAWYNAVLRVELADDEPFTARLHDVDLARGVATLHQLDRAGQLVH